MVRCLILSSVTTSWLVSSMGDRWAWGVSDWSLRADRKIDTGESSSYLLSILYWRSSDQIFVDDAIDAFVPDDDEEVIREPREVEAAPEPRNFIKDKLCAIGLADVSIYWAV